ncbi:hypothetical protein V6N13_001651 [Hibiscus sabdariffa]
MLHPQTQAIACPQAMNCFNNLPRQDDKGDVSGETIGPAWAVAWADDQNSAECLAVVGVSPKTNHEMIVIELLFTISY